MFDGVSNHYFSDLWSAFNAPVFTIMYKQDCVKLDHCSNDLYCQVQLHIHLPRAALYQYKHRVNSALKDISLQLHG